MSDYTGFSVYLCSVSLNSLYCYSYFMIHAKLKHLMWMKVLSVSNFLMFNHCEIKCWFDFFVSSQISWITWTSPRRWTDYRRLEPSVHPNTKNRSVQISTYVWLCLPTLYQLQCKRSIYELTDIIWISLFFLSLSLSHIHMKPHLYT